MRLSNILHNLEFTVHKWYAVVIVVWLCSPFRNCFMPEILAFAYRGPLQIDNTTDGTADGHGKHQSRNNGRGAARVFRSRIFCSGCRGWTWRPFTLTGTTTNFRKIRRQFHTFCRGKKAGISRIRNLTAQIRPGCIIWANINWKSISTSAWPLMEIGSFKDQTVCIWKGETICWWK